MSGRKYLADWDLALKHQKASSLGRDSKNIDDPQNKTCKCCLQQINKEPIPLCENTK